MLEDVLTVTLVTVMFQWTGGPCPFYIFNAPSMNSSSDCLATPAWTPAAAATGSASTHQVC